MVVNPLTKIILIIGNILLQVYAKKCIITNGLFIKLLLRHLIYRWGINRFFPSVVGSIPDGGGV